LDYGPELCTADLPPEFREAKAAPNSEQPALLSPHRHLSEVELIREALQVAGGNLEKAANFAGMSRATFWRKGKKYNI
jgi:transcriptional regulator of acetoin/glycerol metabolism